MAHNLLKKGHSLVVYDLNQESLDRVQAQAKALNLKGKNMHNEASSIPQSAVNADSRARTVRRIAAISHP